ncbi:uncharacterized protein LOC117103378 [Anneissia japonica]|uniref:uncharacterized protein LOC117103378 n=1 Tax=Anneissia japonica TaxID=1529436 RepID=UPI00142584E5|nr:uncharacterized protein LOC117103378 [Anneissia japonica]XP_033099811.1 uncharacterized protein LOC117103378 [Anneissia japonica]
MMFEDDEQEDVEIEDDNNSVKRQHGLGKHKKMLYEGEQEDYENYHDDEDVIVQYGSGKHAKKLPDRGTKIIRDTESEHSDEDDEKDFNDIDLGELCVIRKLNEKFNKKFNMLASDHLITLIGLDNVRFIEILPLFNRILEYVLDSILINVQPHDMVRCVIRENGLDLQISLPFRERITPEIIFAAILKSFNLT